MSRKSLAVLLAALFAAPASRAQQPAQPPAAQEQEESIKVSAAVVQLDVIVTDKTGRRVTGLAASDFQVTDEGRPQPVDYFTAVDASRVVAQKEGSSATAGAPAAAGAAAAGSSPLLRPYSARHIALVVDDQNLSHENLLRARRALADYVVKLSPNDMVALVSTGGRFGLLQQFTTDRQRLLSAINRVVATGDVGANALSPRFKMTVAEAQRVDQNHPSVIDAIVTRASTEDIGGGAFMSREQLEGMVKSEARAFLTQAGMSVRVTLGTLENLFKAMADLPGRKTAVLLSESLIALGNTTASNSDQLTQLTELARRSGVSVYALDAAGLTSGSASSTQYISGAALRARDLAGNAASFTDFERLDAARALAVGTGGTLIAGNDIGAGIDRAIQDASSYYVVGFRPAALDNRFHHVAVTVKGKPDLVVRTRRGYLAVNQETARGTSTELAAALLSPVPLIDLPVNVVANVVPQAGAQTVRVGFHVGRNYLRLPAEGAADQTAAYEILAYIFAAGRDQPVGGVHRTLTVDLSKPEERQRLKTSGLVFVPEPFALEPGQHQIRVVVREKATGAVGSAYQFFDVPNVADKKTVSASSVLINPAGQTGFTGANSFRPGAEVDVRFVVYNPPKDAAELTQQVRLLDSQGRALLDSPLTFVAAPADNPSMAIQSTRFRLPPARGRYALVVSLRDRKGKVDVERRADFVIE